MSMGVTQREARLRSGLASAAVAAGLFSGPAFAEQAPETTTLPVVSVEGGQPAAQDGSATAGYRTGKADLGPLGQKKILDTPYTVNVIPSDLIENTSTDTLRDALKFLPNVTFEQRFGSDGGRPQTRGFEVNPTDNVRIDGLNAGQSPVGMLPVEAMDSIQVLDGTTSFIYGPSAPGGVFNFITKRPLDKPYASLTTEYISNAQYNIYGDLSGHLGENDFLGYRIFGLSNEGQSFTSNSNRIRNFVDVAVDLKLTPTTLLQLFYSHYYYSYKGLPGNFQASSASVNAPFPSPVDAEKAGYGQSWAGTQNHFEFASIRLKQDFDHDWYLLASMGRVQQSRVAPYVTNTFTATPTGYTSTQTVQSSAVNALDSISYSNLLTINGKFDTGPFKHDLSFGTVGQWTPAAWTSTGSTSSTYSSTTGLYSPVVTAAPASWTSVYNGTIYRNSDSITQSIVAGDTVALTRQFSLVGGLAYSWLGSRSYNASEIEQAASSYLKTGLSPTGSLIYKPIENVSFYATYAASLNAGENVSCTTCSNYGQTLAPARSKQYEIGNKVDWGGFTTSIAGFRAQRPYAEIIGTLYEDAGEQTNYGVEFQATGKITENLSLFGGITWLDPKLTSTIYPADVGKQVVGVPVWQWQVFGEYKLPWVEGLTAFATVHYTGKRAANDANTAWVSNYATLDLGMRYVTHIHGYKTTFRAAVRNVTNTQYWSSIITGTTGGTSSYAAALGDPITGTFGVQVEF